MSDDKRLSHLLTYTTFHIGVYISLLTALIGVGIFETDINMALLRYSAVCILLAGFFGGTIGSNIPDAVDYGALQDKKLRVLFGYIEVATLQRCINLEHFFFWAGILPPALVFIFTGKL